jgi:hypothetical protein
MSAKTKPTIIDLAEDLSDVESTSVETVSYDEETIKEAHLILAKLRNSADGKRTLNALIPTMVDGRKKFIQNGEWFNLYLNKEATIKINNKQVNVLDLTTSGSDLTILDVLRISATTGGYLIKRNGKPSLVAKNFIENKSNESEYYIGFLADSQIEVF